MSEERPIKTSNLQGVTEPVHPVDPADPEVREHPAEPVEALPPHPAEERWATAPASRTGRWRNKLLILSVVILALPIGWLVWRAQDYQARQGHWPTVDIMTGWLSGQADSTPFEQAWKEQHQAMQGQVLALRRQNEGLSGRVQTLEGQNRDLAARFDALSERLEVMLTVQSIPALPVQGDVASGVVDSEVLTALERRLQTLEGRVAERLEPQAVAPALLQVLWDRGWYGAVAALAESSEDRLLAHDAVLARRELLTLLHGEAPAEEQHYWGGLVTLRQGGGRTNQQAAIALLTGDWQGLAQAMRSAQGVSPQAADTFERLETLRRQGEGRWASSAS